MTLREQCRERVANLRAVRARLEQQVADAADDVNRAAELVTNLSEVVRCPDDARCVAAATVRPGAIESLRRAQSKLLKLQQELQEIREHLPLWETLGRPE